MRLRLNQDPLQVLMNEELHHDKVLWLIFLCLPLGACAQQVPWGRADVPISEQLTLRSQAVASQVGSRSGFRMRVRTEE